MDVSVVIPVYGSEESLPALVARLEPVLQAHTGAFEVILVNDGSPDGSWAVIASLCERHPWVRGINLLRNFGQHNALLCGVRAAVHPHIVTMDDDLQHPPEAIPSLLAELCDGVDVVYGTPAQEQHGFLRDLASVVTKLGLRAAMGVEVARHVSAFRAFRTDLRKAFAEYRGPYVSVDVLLSWGTSRFTSVRVDHHPRKIGTSHYSFRKLLTHALNMMTGFSTVPLRLASLLGFGFSIFGAFVLAYVLGRFVLQGVVVPGFVFIASTVAIFSGVQLFALGIIGEYLARMHFRIMDRPAYVVGEETRNGKDGC